MKILVTGSDGFIGARLCHRLLQKNIVFEKFKGDLLDKTTYNAGEFDIIIHLAALITHLGNWSDAQMRAVNINGTKKLLDYYPKSKLILISTADVAKQSLTPYAKTKLAAEKLVQRNKKNLIIRLPSVFGPEQKQDKLIPRLIRHYYQGKDCQIENNSLREYIYVDDVAKKIIGNLRKSGLISFAGIKIKNLRLKELIESIYLIKSISGLSSSEKKLRNQLVKCCQSYK